MSVLSSAYGTGQVILSRAFVTLPVPSSTPELSDQVMIVTGANIGLGYESSLHLSRLGVGKLIMAVRTLSKGEAARERILEATGRLASSIEVWPIDMDDYDSVKAFASRAAAELPRLDGVLANAGIWTTKYARGGGGHESTLNINVVSTFLLYLLLLPHMRHSSQITGNPCRFAVPNSTLHFMAPLEELDPNQESILGRLDDPENANMDGRYPMTKLLVTYAVRELADMARSSGKGSCILNTPNPSFCKSRLGGEMRDSRGFKIFETILARSTEEGSRALVHGLLAGEETNGQYLANCHVAAPACHVTSKWGQNVQKKFVKELLATLETIQPGLTSSI